MTTGRSIVGAVALLPVLLACGCSLTFYGLKEVKEPPPKKTALAACIEPRADKAKAAVAFGPPRPATLDQAPTPAAPGAKATSAEVATPSAEPATKGDEQAQAP